MRAHGSDPQVWSTTRRALLRAGLGGLFGVAGSMVGCTAPWRGVPSPTAPDPTVTNKSALPVPSTDAPKTTLPLTLTGLTRRIPPLMPTATPPPVQPPTTASRPPGSAPAITAQSALVWDATRRVELYAKAPDNRVIPASTTKIVTALLVLEHAPLDLPVRIAPVDLALPEGLRQI